MFSFLQLTIIYILVLSPDLEKGANFHSRQIEEGELLKKGKFVFTIENISNIINHKIFFQPKIKFSPQIFLGTICRFTFITRLQ